MNQNEQTASTPGAGEPEQSVTQTPLEQVHQQQAMAQENLEVAQQRNEPSPEIVGASIPSDKRHHPQRQMYDSGKNKTGSNDS